MAPLDRNFVTRVALIGVLIGIFMTDSTIACNNDVKTCRYDCPAEVVQEHCTSENEIHCTVDGKCCPGYFRTKNSCQVCPDVHFMPDVNDCCECLPCVECDGIKNNTEVVPCYITSDTVCKIQDDPTPRGTSACPWIGSTSTPTTQVPTTDTEESTVNTPSDPLESKSDWTSLEIGFFTIVGPFIVVFLVILMCYKSEKIRRTCAACLPGGQLATAPGGQPATAPGGQPATAPGGQPATAPGGQPATTPGGQPATAPGGQPATAPGGQPATTPGGQPATTPGGQPATTPGGLPVTSPEGLPVTTPGSQSATPTGSQPNDIGDSKEVDDPDEHGEPNEHDHLNAGGTDQTDDENDRTRKEVANIVEYSKRRTVCDKCQQVMVQEDATVKNGDHKEVDDVDKPGKSNETDPLMQ